MDNWIFDTTYILPYFGINIDLPGLKEKMKFIQNTYPKNFKITTCSLIECKWKAISLYKKENNEAYLKRANDAFLSFTSGNYFEIIDPWFVPDLSSYADELLKAGHNDYMDCWIFATAKILKFNILSEDKKIKNVIKKLNSWKNLKICDWNKFCEEYQIFS